MHTCVCARKTPAHLHTCTHTDRPAHAHTCFVTLPPIISPPSSCTRVSQAGAEPAEMMIRDLVACEHEYINTDHPDFIGGTRAVKVGATAPSVPCWGCYLCRWCSAAQVLSGRLWLSFLSLQTRPAKQGSVNWMYGRDDVLPACLLVLCLPLQTVMEAREARKAAAVDSGDQGRPVCTQSAVAHPTLAECVCFICHEISPNLL